MPASGEWLISVDDHVIEPGHVWESRLPAGLREQGPHLVELEGGVKSWKYEDKVFHTRGLWAAAGKRREEFSPRPVSYEEMRPGCYEPRARVADMDEDGVLASLCFPSFPRFCGQTFLEARDKGLAGLCVRAWNDFIVEEWAGSAPGRFIPMIILPLWDPAGAAAEIERTAGRGARAIAFSENPAKLGLPSIHAASGYWNPVLAAAEAAGMALCTHIGSSSSMPSTSPDAPTVQHTATAAVNLMLCTTDWIFSGMFDRFPGLRLVLSEGGIGWIPYLLDRFDDVVEKQKYWAAKAHLTREDVIAGKGEEAGVELPAHWDYSRLPSEIFRQNIYGCFIDEKFGVKVIDEIGVDNVMIETDYPHTDSTWPNSQAIAAERLKHLSPQDRYKVTQGNAIRVFNFTPAPIPAT